MAPPPFSAAAGERTYIERTELCTTKLQAQWTGLRGLVSDLSEQVGRETVSLSTSEQFPDGFCRQDPIFRFRSNDNLSYTLSFRMGAQARQGESPRFTSQIEKYSDVVVKQVDGHCEGGDIIPIFGSNLIFIGERQNVAEEEVRTDNRGIAWFRELMEDFGFLVQTVPFHHVLHLTTCASYLGKADDGVHCVGLNPASIERRLFENCQIRVIETPEGEEWAANGIPIGDNTILQCGYPGFYQRVVEAGFSPERLHCVDLSEAAKTETSTTCMINDETIHPDLLTQSA